MQRQPSLLYHIISYCYIVMRCIHTVKAHVLHHFFPLFVLDIHVRSFTINNVNHVYME